MDAVNASSTATASSGATKSCMKMPELPETLVTNASQICKVLQSCPRSVAVLTVRSFSPRGPSTSIADGLSRRSHRKLTRTRTGVTKERQRKAELRRQQLLTVYRMEARLPDSFEIGLASSRAATGAYRQATWELFRGCRNARVTGADHSGIVFCASQPWVTVLPQQTWHRAVSLWLPCLRSWARAGYTCRLMSRPAIGSTCHLHAPG
jgi:hypothetical protein